MPCSSTSRASTRRAACCCLRHAVRSARSIASISGFAASSFGDRRTGVLRAGGTAEASAARTVRRCTPRRSARARTESSSRRASRRIASNNSTRDPNLGPPASVVDHDYDGAGTPRPATVPGRVGGWGQIKPSPDLATTTSWSGVGHIKPSRWGRIRLTGAAHQADGEPVVSVDTKKKEQLGELPAVGREWRPKGEPVQVEDHSFFTTGPDTPVAVPYGIYDVSADSGWVNVGIDHDTSAFAVASIRRWWQARGTQDYPNARRLLITADAGGSNSYRYRLWKAELATLAAETDLTITVCHFPPGTSKWNKIEHRLFSHITMNWRGRPLTSHEVVVATIASTRTRTGLRVHAELDTASYPLSIAVSREQMQALRNLSTCMRH